VNSCSVPEEERIGCSPLCLCGPPELLREGNSSFGNCAEARLSSCFSGVVVGVGRCHADVEEEDSDVEEDEAEEDGGGSSFCGS